MALLTDKDIRRIVNKRDLVIHPLTEGAITGLGYDLHIGCIQPLSHLEAFTRVAGIVSIPPGGYCAIITREFVWISGRLAGTLHARGTLAAKGLFTSATNVDPNFKGQMIMSVVNLSAETIVLEEEQTFITLLLHETRSPTKMLIGTEVAKNTTRVTLEMTNKIYAERGLYANELESVNKLHHYLTDRREHHSYQFDDLINKASRHNSLHSIMDFFRAAHTAYTRSIHGRLYVVLLLATYIFTLCSVLWLGLSILITHSISNDDWRSIVLVAVAILSLLTAFKPKA